MTTVAIYQHNGSRPRVICDALQAGAEKMGFKTTRTTPYDYEGHPEADIAAFYGLRDGLLDIMKDYINAGKTTILADFGYWGRLEGGRYSGYHKLVVNGRHCEGYFQNQSHDSDRFERLGIDPLPMRNGGDHILLAGMSMKAAWVVGLKPEEWERQVVSRLKETTNLPIIYRPKPSWPDWHPIEGCRYSPPEEDLNELIDGAYAVVSHHSNVGIDALVRGCPILQVEGAAVRLACDPFQYSIFWPPDEKRDQFLYDLAYTQFKPDEIASGYAWAHLMEEGLL